MNRIAVNDYSSTAILSSDRATQKAFPSPLRDRRGGLAGEAASLAATWRFNKARGSHSVDLDAELIRALIEQGLSDDEVGTRLGVDLDTVHRYKQVTGIAALFARSNYSAAWSMTDDAVTPVAAGA